MILYNNPLQSFDIRPLPGGSKSTKVIVLGDFDGNDQLDIMIGNEISKNMVLLNNGTRTFNISYVFDDTSTSCIALGDLNNDTKLDIVVGTDLSADNILWLNNGDGTFTWSLLPRLYNENYNIAASSIALGDLNGDGIVDILIGNNKGKNLLLQKRKDGENFHVKILEAESSNQEFKSLIVLGDVNGDGVIDIVVANKDITSQVMFQSSCPHGGAQRHVYSWCFK